MSEVITILPDGRVIAKASITATSRLTAGAIPITVTVTALKKVEKVLNYDISTSPQTNWSPTGLKITNNVVGVTIYVASGTTISGEVLVLGY